MPTIAAQRAAFATTAASTATPQALLVMLYDRLVLDLQRAETAQRSGDLAGTHRHLVHAQDIVAELSAALDVDAWEGARQLRSLYTWLFSELVEANVTKDAERTAACRALVEPLRDAWREAAAGVAGSAPTIALGGTA